MARPLRALRLRPPWRQWHCLLGGGRRSRPAWPPDRRSLRRRRCRWRSPLWSASDVRRPQVGQSARWWTGEEQARAKDEPANGPFVLTPQTSLTTLAGYCQTRPADESLGILPKGPGPERSGNNQVLKAM